MSLKAFLATRRRTNVKPCSLCQLDIIAEINEALHEGGNAWAIHAYLQEHGYAEVTRYAVDKHKRECVKYETVEAVSRGSDSRASNR